jgi:hypothetical protein
MTAVALSLAGLTLVAGIAQMPGEGGSKNLGDAAAATQSTDQDSGPAMSGTIPTPSTSGSASETGTSGQTEVSGTDPVIPVPHMSPK